jgi:hypothetical protein
LSNRYSTSPALHLKLGESRLRATLYRALCGICTYALWLIYARGYGVLTAVLAMIVVYLLLRLRRDRLAGAELCWRQGRWTLEQAGAQRVIVPGKRSTAMPWAIYLAFTDQTAGRGGHMWLYADCASSTQLRRLRVRLTLEC